jgi:predicted RNase H-like HicB family nuclease
MKSKLNQKRRAGLAFNSVDQTTGYAIRFVLGKSGTWSVKPTAFVALSNGMSLQVARRHAAEAIQICLEDYAQMGWLIPQPERESICQ